MLNKDLKLNHEIFTREVVLKSTRDGFGDGLLKVGERFKDVVVLSADLSTSTRAHHFAQQFPERFIQIGVAEQNMAGVAAGLSQEGKVAFMTSHACFIPYRNWDQIRASICLSNANVKIVSSHLGFTDGPAGAIAQPLEDIALTRVLPNMVVIQPVDALEAEKATLKMAETPGPMYLRLAKIDTPLITTPETPFELGKALVLSEGKDVTLVSSGPITYEALLAVKELKTKHNVSVDLIVCSTIKPLDEEAILLSARKTKRVLVVEEHQIIGGLGSAVCELLSEQEPLPVKRIGVTDCFGQSGSYQDLKDKYGLSFHTILNQVLAFIKD